MRCQTPGLSAKRRKCLGFSDERMRRYLYWRALYRAPASTDQPRSGPASPMARRRQNANRSPQRNQRRTHRSNYRDRSATDNLHRFSAGAGPYREQGDHSPPRYTATARTRSFWRTMVVEILNGAQDIAPTDLTYQAPPSITGRRRRPCLMKYSAARTMSSSASMVSACDITDPTVPLPSSK